MQPIRCAAMILVLLVGMYGASAAHADDRLYPIYYLTDEMVEGIRVDDGTIDEWYELVGEPNLTTLDCSDKYRNYPYDPSDLDFRIWLAWHDNPARFYVAFVGSDDLYENDHDYEATFPDNVINAHDSIGFAIDADHGGGPGFKVNTDPTWDQRHEHLGRSQSYGAIARTARGSTLDQGAIRTHVGTSWTTLPPYGEGGGGVYGENPYISVIEAYVTPYDSWVGWEGEEMEISQMTAGQVIGFGVVVYDKENVDNTSSGEDWMAQWTPGSTPDPGFSGPDRYADGLLLGPNGLVPSDSAVEMDSWARIKASLHVPK